MSALITPDVMHAIGLLAEAKMHFLLAAQGTKPGTPERAKCMADLERLTKASREHVDKMGGIEKLPKKLAVELRVCELGLEKLGGPKAPPHTKETL